jgi:hypothetical protein
MILQLANGPDQSPQFANRILVIDTAAKTASIPSLPRSRMEAVENEAIQCAYKALVEIQTRYLFDDDQLPPLLDAVNQKADATSSSMGPIHDLDSTEAFRAIQAAVQRITADMAERFGNGPAVDQTPAVAPAPVPAPTTAPAPTSAPAPM